MRVSSQNIKRGLHRSRFGIIAVINDCIMFCLDQIVASAHKFSFVWIIFVFHSKCITHRPSALEIMCISGDGMLSLKRDNSDILSCLSLFVNNFFHHHDHQPSLSFLPVPVSVSSSRVSLDIISRRQPKVNKNFTFYLQKYKHHKILFPGCLQTTIQS